MRKYFAEFIGTFMLVFVGTGAVVIAGSGETPIGTMGIGVSFGLTVTLMAFAVGAISGGHFNPAVTLAMVLNKRLEKKDAIYYIIAQFLGAVIASAVVSIFVTGLGLSNEGFGQTDFSAIQASNIGLAFFTEILLTFLFVFVILMVTSKKYGVGNFAPLAIGLTLSLLIVVGLNVTGGSLNPARSFGPALFAGGSAITSYWVYLLAPLVGAILAAFAAKFMGSEEA